MRYQSFAVLTVCALLASTLGAESLSAKKRAREVWTVTRTHDPLTDQSSCVVTAYDTVRKMKFSRFGFLYPVIEMNSQHGLLIGVSSGGQYRVPTGDILWRVDSQPHRIIRAADNPAKSNSSVTPFQAPRTGNVEVDERMARYMADAQKMTAAFTATSTVASGDLAEEMLVELVAGKTLLYRQAQVAPEFGLPSSQTDRVGQYTSDEGQVPFRLDESFHRGLKECRIEPVIAENEEPPVEEKTAPSRLLRHGVDGTIHLKSEPK